MLLLVGCNHCSETYQYYTLPFCQPKGGKQYITEDLGEVLEGDRLVTTPFEIKFLQDMEHQQLCNKTLDSKDLDMLRTAVARDFYFQVGVVHCTGSNSIVKADNNTRMLSCSKHSAPSRSSCAWQAHMLHRSHAAMNIPAPLHHSCSRHP